MIDEEFNEKSLPRYFLASNEDFFNSIFSLLDFGGDLAETAWALINRLPTS